MSLSAAITGRRVEVLAALGRFGYLTAAQMLRLGLYSDKKSLYDALRALSRLGLVVNSPPYPKSGQGRGPAVYGLTKEGADLAELPKGETILARGLNSGKVPPTIEHRTAIVDAHIGLATWAPTEGHALERFTSDHAPSGTHGRRATAIETPGGAYTPDALAVLACADGMRRPLVIEVYRGGVKGRPSYVREKLPQDLAAFATDQTAEAFGEGIPNTSAPRLLLLLESERMRTSLLDLPPAPEAPGWQVTYLKTFDEFAASPHAGWWRIGGRQEALFNPREAGQ